MQSISANFKKVTIEIHLFLLMINLKIYSVCMVFRIHLLHAFHTSVKYFYSDDSENRSLNQIRNTRGSSLERRCTYLKIIDSIQIFSKTFLPLLCFENLIGQYPWHCISPLMLQCYCSWCCNVLQNNSCRYILEGNIPLL